jgi:hypothetical protein
MVHGHAPLGLGAGMEQIGKPFGLHQIHPVIDEGPTGKFARLRKSHAINRAKYSKHRVNDRRTSMDVKFGDIFAGSTGRAWHPQDQRLVNDLP